MRDGYLFIPFVFLTRKSSPQVLKRGKEKKMMRIKKVIERSGRPIDWIRSENLSFKNLHNCNCNY